MQVTAGKRLGPYEVVSRIGAGGMGEVWRGRDTRLDRNVAIKILPAEFASNANLKVRFEREAKTISQLSHAHICTLYDVGHEDGTDFLVMELLEGESLADRLLRGPLPLHEVLRYGQQIAEALDRAHRQGVVHRDLKPANVMITRSGAKLLDFGLAKLTEAPISMDGATAHRPLTREGTIVGTFQYMSPEQLEGDEADARSDIFSLGALLFEMATARRAFEGKTKTSLIAAIVSSQPQPVSSVVPLAPPALDHIIQKCLEKDREDRWQSAHDIAEELRWVSGAGSQAGVAIPVSKRRKRETALAAVIALLSLATLWFAYRSMRTVRADQSYRTSIVLPFTPNYTSGALAISPDGTTLAYAAPTDSGELALWIRKFDERTARRIEGTGDVSIPFWSPDGKFIGYCARGDLMRIAAAGGTPEVILKGVDSRGASWNRDGVVLFSSTTRGPVRRVAASGGDPQPVTDPAKLGHLGHLWPFFLPDQKHFLFLAMAADGARGRAGIWIGSLDSKEEPAFLVAADTNAAYADGTILFGRSGVLRGQRFNARSLELEGESVAITPVQYSARYSAAYYSASDSGALVYVERGSEDLSELVWVGRDGKRLGVVASPGYFWAPRLSSDGKRVAVDKSDTNGNGDIWLYETERPSATRLTFDPENESGPHWSPDGRLLYFFINVNRAAADVLIKNINAGSTDRIATPELSEMVTDVSPDGRTLIADRSPISVRHKTDIITYSLDEKKFTPFLATPFSEDSGDFSADGKWIAYLSDESGDSEVYVQSFPPGRGKWQISNGGGTQPRWSPAGGELFYLARDGKLMSVTVKTEPSFEVVSVTPMFNPGLREDRGAEYDLTADGQKFLMNVLIKRTDTPTTLITNWRAMFLGK